MKRKISILVLITAVVLTAACGTATNQDTSNDNNTASNQDAQKEDNTNQEQDSESPDYSVFTNISADEVETFAKQVQEAVANRDWKSLAESTAYPITIGDQEISDEEGLTAFMEDCQLSDEFLKDVAETDCSDLFCNYQGAMFGNGEIWIAEVLNDQNESQGLKVIAVNL